MQTYTVICCDTGNYECSSDPEHTSVRIFLIAERSSRQAARWVREFLIDEFANNAEEWRIIAVLHGKCQPLTAGGQVLHRIDKTK